MEIRKYADPGLSAEFRQLSQARPKAKFDVSFHENNETPKVQKTSVTISRNIEKFFTEWKSSEQIFINKLRTLAPENRSLIELQVSVNRLTLQNNFATQVGEAASNTIKRLHQMGSN